MSITFSLKRTWALIIKEFKELIHDPASLTMIFFLPLLQTILFSFAINDNPKHLSTVIVNSDDSAFTRSLINDLQISSYFDILPGEHSAKSIDSLSARRYCPFQFTQFAVYIPPNFNRDLIRNNNPQILVEADAIDPATVSYALSAFKEVTAQFFQKISGSLDYLRTTPSPIDVIINSKYNPNRITQYNIVPGLLSAVLSLTLVLVTALSVVRERESGTIEILLTTPLKPIEIIIGKITPYILIAYVQSLLILALASFYFKIPIHGSLILLLLCCFPFIIANLALGITFSTVANNQIQSAQATSFYFIPSLLFSGFMFPFSGLPNWGQFIGNMLPSTHFLVIVRGIMLKGSTFMDLYSHIIALLLIILVLMFIAITRFHQTLD